MIFRKLILVAIMCAPVIQSCTALPGGAPGAARPPVMEKKAEKGAADLSPYRKTGFKATSETMVTVDRGDGIIEMSDVSSLNLVAGGDFSFLRRRTHKGAADGVSEESVAAIKTEGGYFTSGSSGLWVRWDDDLDQPEQLINRFFDSEEAILQIMTECGRIQASQVAGRADVALASDGCRFDTGTVSGTGTVTINRYAGNRYAGTLKELSGFIVSNGGNPADISLKLAFDSAVDGVAAAVTMEYTLKIAGGGVPAEIVPPPAWSESRRPRPIKMVESVLSGIVDDWGPGAPDAVRKK